MKQYLAIMAISAFLPAHANALVLSGTSRAYDIQANAAATVDPLVGPTLNLALAATPLNEAQGSAPPVPYSDSDTVVTASTGVIADGILTHNLGVEAGTGVDHFLAASDIDGTEGAHFADAEGNIAGASYALGLTGIVNILTIDAAGSGAAGLITTTASTLSPDGGTITPGGTSNLLASDVAISILGFTPAELGLTLVPGSISSVTLTNFNVPLVGSVSGVVSVGLNLFELSGLSLTSATATSTALRVTLDLTLNTVASTIDVDSSVNINQSTATLLTNAVPEPAAASFVLASGLLLAGSRSRKSRR